MESCYQCKNLLEETSLQSYWKIVVTLLVLHQARGLLPVVGWAAIEQFFDLGIAAAVKPSIYMASIYKNNGQYILP